jgi:hypothetical protein
VSTLVELRGQRPGADDPSVINGTYRLEWTTDELVTATIDAFREVDITPESVAAAWAESYGMLKPGRHTLRLANGRFDHSVAGEDGLLTECTGSYHVLDARVEFVSERGGCEPRRLFNADFESRAAVDRVHGRSPRVRALRQSALEAVEPEPPPVDQRRQRHRPTIRRAAGFRSQSAGSRRQARLRASASSFWRSSSPRARFASE